jgi:hypothetical protein
VHGFAKYMCTGKEGVGVNADAIQIRFKKQWQKAQFSNPEAAACLHITQECLGY